MSDFMSYVKDSNENLAKKLCDKLLSIGYKSAQYAAKADDAAKAALDLIEDGASVGIPGTVTVRQLGLPEKLSEKGCTLHYHWQSLEPEEKIKNFVSQITADWFVTSSNAMTMDGYMINIDGTGNRVAAMSWGPGKLLYIVSLNKVACDTEAAIARARNIATPPNAKRVGANPPCTKTGYCMNCNAPDRICRVVTIMERAPLGREVHAILVGENLGY